MRYYVIAGEASGDLHGSHLIRALRELDPAAECRGWGGELMTAAGADIVKHYRELAFMGFVEVVMNLRTILRNERACRVDIEAFAPDRLILIDYPGFNLRIARWARKAGYDITYYISPQVWAWHTSRVKQLRDNVDRLLVILPFEEAFFAEYGVESTFVGHPLLDVVDAYGYPGAALPGSTLGYPGAALPGNTAGDTAGEQSSLAAEPNAGNTAGDTAGEQSSLAAGSGPVLLLPGSRKQEITTGLPIMLAAAARWPDHDYIVAGAPGQEAGFYQKIIASCVPAQKPPRLEVVHGKTYELLLAAHAALVTSGTATLETALFGVPEVVCYRGNPISYAIAKRLVASRIKYISLVNLVMDEPVVPELIQADFNPERLAEELKKIIAGPERDRQLSDLGRLRDRLGDGGAARRAAAAIIAE